MISDSSSAIRPDAQVLMLIGRERGSSAIASVFAEVLEAMTREAVA